MCVRVLLLALLLLALGRSSAQTDATSPPRGPYALVAYGGLGASLYARDPDLPGFLDAQVSPWGFMGTARLMWHPDHLLRIGIESGRSRFFGYRFGDASEAGEVDVHAVPLLLVWSMPVTPRGNVFLGYGYYRITSELSYLGSVSSSTWSMGWMAAANYVHPINDRLGLGAELKWMNASEARNSVFGAQAVLQWRAFTW
jgi:hypothetical protein